MAENMNKNNEVVYYGVVNPIRIPILTSAITIDLTPGDKLIRINNPIIGTYYFGEITLRKERHATYTEDRVFFNFERKMIEDNPRYFKRLDEK